jgi:hypothetical protein
MSDLPSGPKPGGCRPARAVGDATAGATNKSADMEVFIASRFPNGKRKSEMYEIFLIPDDFRCTLEQFAHDIEEIRLEEQRGDANCEWYRDTDGQLVVARLELKVPSTRLVITNDGFVRRLQEDARPLVFVSYAREDIEAALLLADRLADSGFRPWIDRRHLLGGQRWKTTIEDAIQASEFFVPLLSLRSVDKRGFVQREIRRAIDVAENLPERTVFIVPVRLDDVQPAHSVLRDINWVDLFPEWDLGVKRLVWSLHAARAR